jgi:hypothetical protein
VALAPDQTTWGTPGTTTARAIGMTFGANRLWRVFRSPQALRARSAQPVLICDGTDANGEKRGGRMIVRGLEIQYRPRAGRRGS